tara:strand:- start:1023 stop:1628 length:606 start_codon:yes stop_codon:yes gene_type:complete
MAAGAAAAGATKIVGGKLAEKMAGSALAKYFSTLMNVTGQVGSQATRQVLRAGTDKFAPNVAQSALNPFLRSGAQSLTPKVGSLVAQTGVIGAGLAPVGQTIDQVFDQQSKHSQPIKQGTTGDRGMDDFLLRQQLQNQKFELDMQLVQAKANALVPKNQPNSAESMLRLAEAEKVMTEAGELTNKEVQGIARSIYGTGTRL